MGFNLPSHVSTRDFDGDDFGTCPVCDGDTLNFEGHGCDEDCSRGCRKQVAAPCDTCAKACDCCGEVLGKATPDARGWCPDCVLNEEV